MKSSLQILQSSIKETNLADLILFVWSNKFNHSRIVTTTTTTTNKMLMSLQLKYAAAATNFNHFIEVSAVPSSPRDWRLKVAFCFERITLCFEQ